MDTGADKRLFTIDPTLAECITPLAIDSPAECSECSIDSVQIGGGGTNIHNLLLGLQGGSTDQYYHLSSPQYQAALNANDPTGINPFATLADLTGTYSFTNGITQSGSNVVLGGAITSNTQLDLTGDVVFSISGQTENARLVIQYIPDALNQFVFLPDGSNIGMHLSYGSVNGAQVSATAADQTSVKAFDWYFDHQGFLILDQIDSFGMAYVDDYSANGTQNDRWIPDWGTVKSLTDGLNFIPYTGATGDVDLGVHNLTAGLINVPDLQMSGNGSQGFLIAKHRNGITLQGVAANIATFNDNNGAGDTHGISLYFSLFLDSAQTAIGVDPYEVLVRNTGGSAHGLVQTLTRDILLDRTSVTFAALPGTAIEGMIRPVSNSTTNTWGDIVTGSGSFHVLAYYNGINWTVIAK